MKEKLLSAIGEVCPLHAREAGDCAETVVNGMTVHVDCFDAEGFGNVSWMHGGIPGMMEMDTLILNPFAKDMPLFSYDRIHAGGNDTLFLELYDTGLCHRPDTSALDAIKKAQADLADVPVKSAWYDDILYPESLMKVAPESLRQRMDAVAEQYLAEYLRLWRLVPVCEPAEKKKAASAYTEGLLNNGGASTDIFLQAKGKAFTQKLFRTALFGTGNP